MSDTVVSAAESDPPASASVPMDTGDSSSASTATAPSIYAATSGSSFTTTSTTSTSSDTIPATCDVDGTIAATSAATSISTTSSSSSASSAALDGGAATAVLATTTTTTITSVSTVALDAAGQSHASAASSTSTQASAVTTLSASIPAATSASMETVSSSNVIASASSTSATSTASSSSISAATTSTVVTSTVSASGAVSSTTTTTTIQSSSQSTHVSSSHPSSHSNTMTVSSYPPAWKPRSVSMYKREKMTLIGEGTYGSVFLARTENEELVALKKIRKEKKEGFPITAIREIKILKALKHPNIVNLKDVVSSHEPSQEGNVFMVFEFCEHDLTGLMESGVQMSESQIKYYMKCILEGLDYCHRNKILHRDIKGANILISNNGDVKIADFGLARIQAKWPYTNRVVTLWYRPPELLLGQCEYDSKIDMWSMGCLFAELLTRGRVLFPGNNTDMDQLNHIYNICGTPNEENWPGVSKLKYFQQFTPTPRPRKLAQHFQGFKPCAIDLLDKLLTLDPNQRIDADKALNHDYFWKEEPKVMKAQDHPKYTGYFHEYSSKKKRRNRDAALAAGAPPTVNNGPGPINPNINPAMPISSQTMLPGMQPPYAVNNHTSTQPPNKRHKPNNNSSAPYAARGAAGGAGPAPYPQSGPIPPPMPLPTSISGYPRAPDYRSGAYGAAPPVYPPTHSDRDRDRDRDGRGSYPSHPSHRGGGGNNPGPPPPSSYSHHSQHPRPR